MNNRIKFLNPSACLQRPQTNPPRVPKACDRCRLKKTKCDGKKPCSRCEAEDAVCLFATSKKFRNVVHPKGSVEMLLQQQEWLVSGLLELYRRTQLISDTANDSPNERQSGVPSVHHILEQLGVLDKDAVAPDSSIEVAAKQFVFSRLNNESQKPPHPQNVGHVGGHFEVFDELKGQLSYEKATIEASSDVFMSTIDDPFDAFSEFQHTAQKAEVTLVDEGFGLIPSPCCEFPPGFGGRDEGILGTDTKLPFDVTLPTLSYGDKGSIFTRDVFEQQHHPRSPILHTRPVFRHTTSSSQTFGNGPPYPVMHRQGPGYG